MKLSSLLILTLCAVGCGLRGPKGASTEILERELIHRALSATPLDSITDGGARFSVVTLDPRIRRIPIAGTVDPLHYPVAFRVSFDRNHFRFRTPLIVREQITRDADGDTLDVILAIVDSVSDRATRARVLIFMTNAQSLGIVGSIVFERVSEEWRAVLIHFQEG